MFQQQGLPGEGVQQVAHHGAGKVIFVFTTRRAAALRVRQGDKAADSAAGRQTPGGKPGGDALRNLPRAQAGGQDQPNLVSRKTVAGR
jgi:hypothetical protein